MYNTHVVGIQGLELTEEEKRQAAEQRDSLVKKLQIFVIIQLLAGLALLAGAITSATFYHDNIIAMPYFVGGFIGGPGHLIGALGSYLLMRIAKDFSVQKVKSEACCAFLPYIAGLMLGLIGGIIGVSIGASSSAVTKEKCPARRTTTCTDDPNPETNQILAFIMIGLCALSLVLSIVCIILMVKAPLAFKTQRTLTHGRVGLQQQNLVLQQQLAMQQMALQQQQMSGGGYGGAVPMASNTNPPGMQYGQYGGAM